MLTKTGAKLMDFGLAKASVASASAASGLSAILAMPQGSHPLTTQGICGEKRRAAHRETYRGNRIVASILAGAQSPILPQACDSMDGQNFGEQQFATLCRYTQWKLSCFALLCCYECWLLLRCFAWPDVVAERVAPVPLTLPASITRPRDWRPTPDC